MEIKTDVRTNLLITNRVIGNTVHMLMNQPIGQDPKNPHDPFISGPVFAEEMYYWRGQNKQLVVKINSPGGQVVQGWDLVDAINETQADTLCAGIAYSMAGICLMAGKNRSAYPHASAMIHAPRGGSKEILDVIKNQFRALLKSRTKFTDAEITTMMDSGENYFFNAKEMLAKGMIDSITPMQMDKMPSANLSPKELCNFYNSIEEPKNDKTMFANLIAKITGKDNETDQVLALNDMKAKSEALTATNAAQSTEITVLKAKIQALETAQASAAAATEAKTKAEKLIEDAEKAGKLNTLKPEDKVKLVENAIANYDGAKLMIDSMKPVKTASASAIIDTDGKKVENTYEWLAQNKPNELARLYNEDRALFDKLSDEFIAKSKEAQK